jgi:tetratricopeptide (TPR) repeat protein
LRGEIRKQEESEAWNKSGPSLAEYDYYLRGHQLFFKFTKEDNAKARQVWQEGLAKFPDSALLRAKVAFTYARDIFDESTDDPWRATELGWKLVKEAEAVENKSRLETLLTHWTLAYFTYFRGEFERSADEAEIAARMVPNDSFTRADLAQFLTFAGRPRRAVEWLEEAIRRDANPAEWYYGNLGLAYYLNGQPEDAIAQFLKMNTPSRLNLAAAYVRVGRLEDARRLIAEFRKDYPRYTVADEALWPTYRKPQYSEPLLKPYLADLVTAGLPEK